MPPRALKISLLLFGSGLCALVYQTAWLREFRLVFGASTAASAAVLAIFIGGLGAGSLVIGPRVDSHPRPLWLYARLETLIALSAAVTPFLLWLVRRAYVAAGGTEALGSIGGTGVRLVLAALVLALPTFLMGGTLPAAARAATPEGESRRQSVALLYGVNTLGAVAGAFLSTFFMFELFGTRHTLWLACLVNLLVVLAARSLARRLPDTETEAAADPAEPAAPAAAPPAFVLAAAGLVGFCFFLMELVWYRMLGPLLGGSVFTFGLILAVALLGIGLGGWVYSTRQQSGSVTLLAFALSCLVEAGLMALPFALGDRIAIAALLMRSVGDMALFWGQVASWTAICTVVVFPPAFVAGYQFPLLVALLGRGRERIGRQVGLAYACNTAGAMLGSLAGGFGLIPYLSAPGTWQATCLLLVALGLAAGLLSVARSGRRRSALVSVGLVAGVAVALTTAVGPTAVWRHSAIGAGRAPRTFRTGNQLEDWMRQRRGSVVWEADGVESSVAVLESALVINGKSDGDALIDASTMIMTGLLGGLLHPAPRTGFIIGLGTGMSAGWMASMPGMERVDVVELEPLVLRAAGDFSAANHDALNHPRVHITIGDAREKLLVSREQYDLIFSEPSNPYRAGVASLFAREYYEAIEKRLSPGGLFLQWFQAYEVDSDLARTVYATLRSVFPVVETWQVGAADLTFVASREPLPLDVERFRERLAMEPFRSGALVSWGATDAETALAWHVASAPLATAIAVDPRSVVNTDDRNVVEFGSARAIGRFQLFRIADLRALARQRGQNHPALVRGAVDWSRVDEALSLAFAPPPDGEALMAYWAARGDQPDFWRQTTDLAEARARAGDEAAFPLIEEIRSRAPSLADGVLARLRWAQGRGEEALEALERALLATRVDPWLRSAPLEDMLNLAVEMVRADPSAAGRLEAALSRPFGAHVQEQARREARGEVLSYLPPDERCREFIDGLGGDYPWRETWLELRVRCWQGLGDPRLETATRDLLRFREEQPPPFDVRER